MKKISNRLGQNIYKHIHNRIHANIYANKISKNSYISIRRQTDKLNRQIYAKRIFQRRYTDG